ncbi:tyrosine recombinase [Sharpea azabuensis]|uniref:Tyrosine recombinase n=1 Tax=Sharpea porci TaxID=2652286 RepID=A0A844FRY4_9FIRM|nr:tyrosine recombinase [Sharpea porci]MST88444.1 tyrosine recombinase [Sharpea porci]
MQQKDYIQEFETYLLLEKGLSENTTINYIRDLQQFFTYMKKDIGEIEEQDIIHYLKYLNEHYATSSIVRKMVTLRQFFLYLKKNKMIEHNIMANIDMPKSQKHLPQTVSLESVTKVLHTIDQSSPAGKRDYLMLLLSVASGVRVSELIHLTTNDFNYKAKRIRVVGKGNKERLVPLDAKTCDLLEDYIHHERQVYDKLGNKEIFLNHFGKMISREEFYNILQKYACEAGISEHLSPHKLRHTFATTLLDGDADLRSIQELLGHSDIATTTIYTHVANEKIVEDYKRFFHRNKKEG